jgi:hypothetical protein
MWVCSSCILVMDKVSVARALQLFLFLHALYGLRFTSSRIQILDAPLRRRIWMSKNSSRSSFAQSGIVDRKWTMKKLQEKFSTEALWLKQLKPWKVMRIAFQEFPSILRPLAKISVVFTTIIGGLPLIAGMHIDRDVSAGDCIATHSALGTGREVGAVVREAKRAGSVCCVDNERRHVYGRS